LYLAQKVSDTEYNLLMQNDINTNGHTQWFFYQVKNTRRNLTVTFNIMNFTKPDSLFNYGMKVSIYSEKRAAGMNSDDQVVNEGVGWFKGGERISYYNNGIKKDVNYYSKSYYTASFSHKFTHDDDVVYFAFCIPYTYTDMMQDLYDIEQDPKRREIITRKTMCKSLAGNDCELLTITAKGDFETMQAKKAVVISARVHPGEVVGSWMMRGVLFFLTDCESEEARMLREKFIFKIIPMLNPDGVINGNYRCSLAGCDLNRRWKQPHKQLHPTVYHTKKLIRDLHNERGVILYCDLHGHSRK
jgi:cytosolic carboxypeptidase protein 2/3